MRLIPQSLLCGQAGRQPKSATKSTIIKTSSHMRFLCRLDYLATPAAFADLFQCRSSYFKRAIKGTL